MSQQPATEAVPATTRRAAFVLVLFGVAWLVVALGDISGLELTRRLGFALGGGVLVLCGVLALGWGREMRSYQARMYRVQWGMSHPPYLRIAFITVAWGLLHLLIGGFLIVAAVIR